ncbi:LysM domain-containing protein [Herbiconiux sp.]|uniref:LysM peptidoglycan-binding domain-containing protein n=1 Tax=Herbiconiux sp. TaxID=1871186 RepID=UPI0025BEB260|nr:LysM domain-containing protein [Herbiconiux sp.]
MVAGRLGRLRAVALGGLVTASALVLLAACTSGAAPGDGTGAAATPPRTSASEPADPVAGADADAPGAAGDAAVAAASWVPEPLPGNAVLATGTFESPDAAVTGNIAVVTDAARVVEIVLTDFALDPEVAAGAAPQMTLLSEPIGEIGCYDTDGYSFQPTPLTGDLEQRMTMGPVDDVPTGDPSFLDQAVIYLPVGPDLSAESPEEPRVDGCYGDTIAIADLEWLTPQDLPELADSGIRSGATGEVGTDADDALSVYVVSEGDSLGQIAARFGVSTEAVLYLNAGRIGPGGLLEDGTVYAGEALNLSQAAR